MARHTLAIALMCLAVFPLPESANDSVAGVGAGGIILGRTDPKAMESEYLFISLDEVKVDYVSHNTSEAEVETVVAYPITPIPAEPHSKPGLADSEGQRS